jgi:hypothetical protein
MTNDKRKPPENREHDDYKQDHWEVLDVESVDKTFATDVQPRPEEIRLDFDGNASASVMRTLADEGDNINISAFLSLPNAVELRDQLNEAIEQARRRESNEREHRLE